jgi:hypothetical protein
MACNAKVRRSSPAQSTRCLLSFFGSSTVAASAWLSSSGLGLGAHELESFVAFGQLVFAV